MVANHSLLLHASGAECLLHAKGQWALAVTTLLLCISLSDVMWRRVSNALSLTGWILGLLLWTVTWGPKGTLASFAASLACLAIGTVLWSQGFVGAGDAKVYAAYAAIVGPGGALPMTLYGVLVAGVLGVMAKSREGSGSWISMLAACCKPQGALYRARKNGQTMPLTVALSAGVWLVMWGGPRWRF